MSHFSLADNVLLGGLEVRPDNVNDCPLYDGIKGDSMAKSLPKTQGTSEATVIIISSEDKDEEEEDEETGEEEENDYQLDAVYSLEANAIGEMRRGQGVSSAGVTSEFDAAISFQWLHSQVS